ncbi:hypothetical protein OJF2_42770 [Aquisphaera giovannonii]|uniref:Uncharacterized protein n=1 Tax=Aquisphaera giovannonii TaxID=406548 RepID=A0A5B9W712_9BACT|nr:dual specificity protein phosphatase family protein [Aquisphaera giovannonii]QEH35720.1 hypothetical protein OJF2_42770 [Aquisphaera giovannonii]
MKLAIAFAILGLAMATLAAGMGARASGGRWLAFGLEAYLAACFLALSAIYAARAAGVEVERILARSRWSPLLRAVLLPYLATGVIALLVARGLGLGSPFRPVAPGLYAGRIPFPDERGRLREAGIDAVLNLCWEFPGPSGPAAGTGIATARVPILDGVPPTDAQFREALEYVERWHAAWRRVLIHCAQGHGRTSTIVAAALVRLGLAEGGDEALARVAAARPGARPSPSQKAALDRYLSGSTPDARGRPRGS